MFVLTSSCRLLVVTNKNARRNIKSSNHPDTGALEITDPPKTRITKPKAIVNKSTIKI